MYVKKQAFDIKITNRFNLTILVQITKKNIMSLKILTYKHIPIDADNTESLVDLLNAND